MKDKIKEEGFRVQHKIAHYFNDVLKIPTVEYAEKSEEDLFKKIDMTIKCKECFSDIDVKTNTDPMNYFDTATFTTQNGLGEVVDYESTKSYLFVFRNSRNRTISMYIIKPKRKSEFKEIIRRKEEYPSKRVVNSRYVIISEQDLKKFPNRKIDYSLWNSLPSTPL